MTLVYALSRSAGHAACAKGIGREGGEWCTCQTSKKADFMHILRIFHIDKPVMPSYYI